MGIAHAAGIAQVQLEQEMEDADANVRVPREVRIVFQQGLDRRIRLQRPFEIGGAEASLDESEDGVSPSARTDDRPSLHRGRTFIFNVLSRRSEWKAEHALIQGLELDGMAVTSLWLPWSSLANGATPEFELGRWPSTWGTGSGDAPPSF